MKRYIAIYLFMFSTIALAVKITKITLYQVEKKDQPKINSCPYLSYQSKFRINKNSSTPECRELQIQKTSEQNKMMSKKYVFYIDIKNTTECTQTNKESIPNINFDSDYVVDPKLNSDKLMLEACTDLVAFYN